MIEFKRLKLSQKDAYDQILLACPGRSREYSSANMYLWGRQETVFFLHVAVHARLSKVYA